MAMTPLVVPLWARAVSIRIRNPDRQSGSGIRIQSGSAIRIEDPDPIRIGDPDPNRIRHPDLICVGYGSNPEQDPDPVRIGDPDPIRMWDPDRCLPRSKSAKECVTTHLPNGLAPKMDGAQAGDRCPTTDMINFSV